MASTNDSSPLIERAKSGDRRALEELLLAHATQLSAHIERRFPSSLRGKIGAEDILQQTLMRAYVDIAKLRQATDHGFVVWLKAIAEMRLIDAVRAEKARKRGGGLHRLQQTTDSMSGRLVDILDKLPADSVTASREFGKTEAALALQVALAGLPVEQREAIRLHLLLGKSVAETAEALARPHAAVRGLVYRGKKNLAEAMGRASMWLSKR